MMTPQQTSNKFLSKLVLPVLCVLLSLGHLPTAKAAEPLPAQLKGSSIENMLGEPVPLDLEFTNSKGELKPLRDYFHAADEKPVVITLVYYSCPVLCNVLLNELNTTMQQMEYTIGDEFEVLTISFDPTETASLAAAKRESYLGEYGRPEAANGWHWMVGDQDNIEALTSAMGFHYQYDPEQQQYAHPPVIYVATPDGKISRMLTQLTVEPRDLRFALLEASNGNIGSVFDHLTLYCFSYNPDGGTYEIAFWVMRAGGAVTIVLLGGLVGGLFWWERRRSRARKNPNINNPSEEIHAH